MAIVSVKGIPMLQVTLVDGEWRPLAFCDNCGKIINERGMGAYLIVHGTPTSPPSNPIYFVHKGHCHTAYEHQLRENLKEAWPSDINIWVGWDELDSFILSLGNNMESDWRDIFMRLVNSDQLDVNDVLDYMAYPRGLLRF